LQKKQGAVVLCLKGGQRQERSRKSGKERKQSASYEVSETIAQKKGTLKMLVVKIREETRGGQVGLRTFDFCGNKNVVRDSGSGTGRQLRHIMYRPKCSQDVSLRVGSGCTLFETWASLPSTWTSP